MISVVLGVAVINTFAIILSRVVGSGPELWWLVDSGWCDLLLRRFGHVVEVDSSWCDLLSRRFGGVVDIGSSCV